MNKSDWPVGTWVRVKDDGDSEFAYTLNEPWQDGAGEWFTEVMFGDKYRSWTTVWLGDLEKVDTGERFITTVVWQVRGRDEFGEEFNTLDQSQPGFREFAHRKSALEELKYRRSMSRPENRVRFFLLKITRRRKLIRYNPDGEG